MCPEKHAQSVSFYGSLPLFLGPIRLSSASARSQKLFTSEATADAKKDISNGDQIQ